MNRFEKSGHSPIKSLSDNWFEMLLITIVLGVVVLAHYLFNVGGVILNFFYLLIIIAAHYYGRKLACVLATFIVVAVVIFTMFDPAQRRFGTHEWFLLVFNLTAWAGFLSMSAIVVGTLSDQRRTALQRVLDRCKDQEHRRGPLPSLRVVGVLERVAGLMRRAQEKLDGERGQAAAELLKEAIDLTQQEVDRAALERRAVNDSFSNS